MMKLHLGCGQQRRHGWVNCDLNKTWATDITFDCQEPWPFGDNVATHIYSSHMLEHLDRPMDFFKEAWRVLIPGGIITLQLPYGASDAGPADLTHKRLWLPGSFCAFQPGYGVAVGNPQHVWDAPFAVHDVACRVGPDLKWLLRWPWRKLGLKVLRYLWGGYVEMFVQMSALKTPDAKEHFLFNSKGNVLPMSVVMWEQDWLGPEKGRAGIVTEFSYGRIENTAPLKE